MTKRIPEEKREEILKLHREGNNFKVISEKTGIKYQTVITIVGKVYPPESRKPRRYESPIVYSPKNPYGLNPWIEKLKHRLKIGSKVSAGTIQGKVIGIYKHVFTVKGKYYIESIGFAEFLLKKGKMMED